MLLDCFSCSLGGSHELRTSNPTDLQHTERQGSHSQRCNGQAPSTLMGYIQSISLLQMLKPVNIFVDKYHPPSPQCSEISIMKYAGLLTFMVLAYVLILQRDTPSYQHFQLKRPSLSNGLAPKYYCWPSCAHRRNARA